jgi:hypothetical protein
MAGTVTLFDPTASRSPAEQRARNAFAGLAGSVVGFIDNSKPNFNHLVDELAEVLVRDYGVKKVVKRRKTSASVPAPGEMVEELIGECDLVITGSGD